MAIVARTVSAVYENPAENTATNPTPDGCQWADSVENFCISGQDKKQLSNVDIDACKKACEDETGFNCYSIDYKASTKDCWLQSKDRYSTKLSACNTYTYHERNCRGTVWYWSFALYLISASSWFLWSMRMGGFDWCGHAWKQLPYPDIKDGRRVSTSVWSGKDIPLHVLRLPPHFEVLLPIVG